MFESITVTARNSFEYSKPISVTILTKNSERTIGQTVGALACFPEVLLLDSGSTDKTLEIAHAFPNVKIVATRFEGFGKTHNIASSLATHDWILSIDSDEFVSPELSQEILALSLNPTCVYSLDRHNFFNGKRIRFCSGWYPDRIIRLYNRKMTEFDAAEVHEKVLSKNLQIVPLQGSLLHTPYPDIASFLSKMQLYSTLFAKENKGKIDSSLPKALGHAAAAFFKSYFLKRGILGGSEGFLITLHNTLTTFYKYAKLAEQNRVLKGQPRE